MRKYQVQRYEQVLAPTLAAVKVAGEVDIECAPQLREELELMFDGECRHVLLDLDGVRHLDSFSLGAFVGVRQKARSIGGTLSFICHERNLSRLFAMTNLDKLFTFFDNLEQFVSAHGAPPEAGGAVPDTASQSSAAPR